MASPVAILEQYPLSGRVEEVCPEGEVLLLAAPVELERIESVLKDGGVYVSCHLPLDLSLVKAFLRTAAVVSIPSDPQVKGVAEVDHCLHVRETRLIDDWDTISGVEGSWQQQAEVSQS